MGEPVSNRRLAKRILSREVAVGVWGVGNIGLTTAAHFADRGARVLGYDPDERRIDRIEDEGKEVGEIENWLDVDYRRLVENGYLTCSADVADILTPDVRVHFVAAPTEKDGEPWHEPLEDVVDALVSSDVPDGEGAVLLVVESTLSPGTTDDAVLPKVRASEYELGEDVLVAVAPRRDWFGTAGRNLRTLPRVYGGVSDPAAEETRQVTGLVCENLVEASDHRHAEAVKSVENAYRHVGIALANQLDRAYPGLDVREVLAHAGTKWNVPTYHPSVGTGGYCIPVASEYVTNGAPRPEELTILRETVRTDREQPRRVARFVADAGVDSVAILGLAYRGDLDVDVQSPSATIAGELVDRQVDVRVADPYFDDDYIASRTGARPETFPDVVRDVDCVLLLADHSEYDLPRSELTSLLSGCELVVDNHALWADLVDESVDLGYRYVGGSHWARQPGST